MSEGAARFYTALFSALTVVGLLVGGAYSVYQYFDGRAKAAQTYELQVKTATLEAKKPFFAKHLDFCSDASSITATLATTNDPKKREAATEDFWLVAQVSNPWPTSA